MKAHRSSTRNVARLKTKSSSFSVPIINVAPMRPKICEPSSPAPLHGSPLLVRMHPLVRRDLPCLGQLDHVHRRRVSGPCGTTGISGMPPASRRAYLAAGSPASYTDCTRLRASPGRHGCIAQSSANAGDVRWQKCHPGDSASRASVSDDRCSSLCYDRPDFEATEGNNPPTSSGYANDLSCLALASK